MKTITNGVGNKENLRPIVWLLHQPRAWCKTSQKEGSQLRFREAHSGFRQNPVSLGNKVNKVRVACGVPFAKVETMLFCFNFRGVTTRAICMVLQEGFMASLLRPWASTSRQLKHSGSLKQTSLAVTVKMSAQHREIWCCSCQTFLHADVEEAVPHKFRMDARSMSLTMEIRSKVCDRSKVHVSSRSLIQWAAVTGFHSSSSGIAMTLERKPVGVKPSTSSWCFLQASEQPAWFANGLSRKDTRCSVMTSACKRDAGSVLGMARKVVVRIPARYLPEVHAAAARRRFMDVGWSAPNLGTLRAVR